MFVAHKHQQRGCYKFQIQRLQLAVQDDTAFLRRRCVACFQSCV